MASNSINFGSRPLHQTNLRNSSGGLVRAVISELDPKDSQDVEALQKIAQSWHGAEYAKKILSFFKKSGSDNPQIQNILTKNNPENLNYYAVEIPAEATLSEKIIGIAMTNVANVRNVFNKKYLYLAFLQAKPDLMFQGKDQKRELRGIGELLIGKTASLADGCKAECVIIDSNNPFFYDTTFKNAGLKKEDYVDPDDYRGATLNLSPEHYQKYLDYIAKTYQTQL